MRNPPGFLARKNVAPSRFPSIINAGWRALFHVKYTETRVFVSVSTNEYVA